MANDEIKVWLIQQSSLAGKLKDRRALLHVFVNLVRGNWTDTRALEWITWVRVFGRYTAFIPSRPEAYDLAPE